MSSGSRLRWMAAGAAAILLVELLIVLAAWTDVGTRPPASANPSQNDAAECSLSGSMKINGVPHRFVLPLFTAALNPLPMVVLLVIG